MLPGLVAAGVFESILVVRGAVVRLAGHLARLDVDDLERQWRFWQHAGLVPADTALSSVVDLSLNPQRIGNSAAEQAGGKL